MDEKKEDKPKKNRIPVRREVILGGLSSIIKTTSLIPLDIVQMRFRYPDTWCVSMFRRMVKVRGGPEPYQVLTAGMLKRRTLASLRWGVFYCLYENHRKSCLYKGLNPLWQGTFLLTGRPVVMNVAKIETYEAVLDYQQQKKKAKEHSTFQHMANVFNARMNDVKSSSLLASMQTMPYYILKTGIIATALLHPLDVMKVRLQLHPGVWGVSLFRNMVRCEGLRAPFTGLTASILRQSTYTTSRLGTYYCLYVNHKSKYNNTPSMPEKIAIGVYAGLVGAFVGCPAEIVLVRMMADGPVDPYRRYRGLVDAFVKIWQCEGICTLWRGALLTMSRSVVISVAQIGTYAKARNYLMEKKRASGALLHLYTSMAASLVTAVLTLPLDTFKTRYQVMYSGSHKDIYNKFRQESGALGFWRGFTPYYLRLTVHTLLTFYLLEVLYDAHKTQKQPIREKV